MDQLAQIPSPPSVPGPWRMLAVALALMAPAAGQTPPAVADRPPVPPGAVAVVGGHVVTVDEFIDEMVARYDQSTGIGASVAANLIEIALVQGECRARGLEVGAADVDAKVDALQGQLRTVGQSIDAILTEQKVTLEEFRRSLRHVVALERLVRADAKLAAGHEVSNPRMKAWLADKTRQARVVRDQSALPAGIFATVNGEPITRREFVHKLVTTEEPGPVRRVVENLVQMHHAQDLLAAHGLTLTEVDEDLEYAFQRRRFESRTEFKGIKFEEWVGQNYGGDPAAWRRSKAFKIKAVVGLLGRRQFTPDQVLAAYDQQKGRFGPTLTVQHLLIQATERPDGKVPSFGEAEVTIRRIEQEIRGGAGFDDRVRLYSQDPSAKVNAGLLPGFTPLDTRFDPSFVRAAAALGTVGEISAPVKSAFGWHLIKLVRSDPVPPLAELEEEVRHHLAEDLFKTTILAARIAIDIRPTELR